MNFSDSSSEDECNIYVNAASKLKAMNRQTKSKVRNKKELEEEDDEEEEDNIADASENVNPFLISQKQTEEQIKETNDCCHKDSEDASVKKNNEVESRKENNDNLVMCIDDDDDNDMSNSKEKIQNKRKTRNSNKRSKAIPPRIETADNLDDSIEKILNDTYDDSLNLSQEENDSYIIIGSPPPAKKCDKDDYEVSVKVLWKSDKLERFEIRRKETFQKIFRHFANVEGVSEDQILITKKDIRVTPFDTPESINWSVIDILDGGVVSADVVKNNKAKPAQNDTEENICKIKIQLSDKRTLEILVKNDEPLSTLAQNCSKQLDIPENKIKFYFDGDLIDTDETPESLDFDDEACIDLKISK